MLAFWDWFRYGELGAVARDLCIQRCPGRFGQVGLEADLEWLTGDSLPFQQQVICNITRRQNGSAKRVIICTYKGRFVVVEKSLHAIPAGLIPVAEEGYRIHVV